MYSKKLPEPLQIIYDLNDFANQTDNIKNQLNTHGILLIKNILNSRDAIYIADKLGAIVGNIDANEFGITDISNNKNGNNEKNSIAFTNKGLILHTDRSPLPHPPDFLMNWVCTKNSTGGESILADGREIYHHLVKHYPETINILTSLDVACFTDGIDTFTGPIFQNDIQNNLKIRFRYDQCAFFKLEALEAIKIFREVAEKFAYIVDFDIGDGYIINNMRWLHGRTAFNGQRMIRRIHIKRDF